jgi:AraC-like DNA-binding protein
MLYLQRPPAPPLSAFIEAFWYTKGYQVPHRRERVLPNGSIQLIINLAQDVIDHARVPEGGKASAMPPSLIVGVQSEYVVIDTADLTEMIGLQFWPGGFVPFFALPADEFSNAQVSLEAVWGPDAARLRDRLQDVQDPGAKFQILESHLLARASNRLVRCPAIDFAVGQFQASQHAGIVGDVTRQLGLSRRRFSQIFRERVGATPKLYSRIRRFQQAVHEIRCGRDIKWVDLALSCGYWDQSHFVNDFRAFSGINPTAYAANPLQWANHVPLEA